MSSGVPAFAATDARLNVTARNKDGLLVFFTSLLWGRLSRDFPDGSRSGVNIGGLRVAQIEIATEMLLAI